MLGANAAHTAGHDLAALGDELAKTGGILIVDMLNVIHAELANLAPALLGTGLHLAIFHDIFSFHKIRMANPHYLL